MNVICLVLDRLHAGYLGAYGNTWIDTPAIDRLASQSVVFDQALVDSPCLERLYRSYWQGWHALCPAPPESRPTLAALLRQAGLFTTLLTDEPQVARHPLALDFDELVEIDPPWQPQTAGEIHQSHFGRCFVEIINWLEAAQDPFLLWCHLGGLGATWDAPLRFRQAYCEPGDPPPPTAADVPDRILPDDYDPDALLGVTQSYAGQVTMLDACLGALLEFLDGRTAGPLAQQTLLSLVSSRGFPLGEHRRVGPCDEALYGELVHVPWMIRLPAGAPAPLAANPRRHKTPPHCSEGALGNDKNSSKIIPAAVRCQALVEPADLWATLLDWLGVAAAPHSPTAASVLPLARGQSDALRDRLCVLGSGPERAIRTPAWYLRASLPSPASVSGAAGLQRLPSPASGRGAGGEGVCDSPLPEEEGTSDPLSELFVKPDDRWEVNNVATRCGQVVEGLHDALRQYESLLSADRLSELPPLGDVLLRGL